MRPPAPRNQRRHCKGSGNHAYQHHGLNDGRQDPKAHAHRQPAVLAVLILPLQGGKYKKTYLLWAVQVSPES
jgi:hypothetical protein